MTALQGGQWAEGTLGSINLIGTLVLVLFVGRRTEIDLGPDSFLGALWGTDELCDIRFVARSDLTSWLVLIALGCQWKIFHLSLHISVNIIKN